MVITKFMLVRGPDTFIITIEYLINLKMFLCLNLINFYESSRFIMIRPNGNVAMVTKVYHDCISFYKLPGQAICIPL